MRHLRALQFTFTCVLLINCALCGKCPYSGAYEANSHATATEDGAKSYVVFSRPQVQSTNPKCPVIPRDCQSRVDNYYYRTFDGSCNNFNYPDFGKALTRYNRLVAPNYADGYQAPSVSKDGRAYPNARTLSLNLYGEETYLNNHQSLAAMQFGQLVAHDLTQMSVDLRLNCCNVNASSNPACYPIATDAHDPMRLVGNVECLNFPRTSTDADYCGAAYNGYAEKITQTTGLLDLSNIYGVSVDANAALRTFVGGQFKTSIVNGKNYVPISRGTCAANDNSCNTFVTPDTRQNNIPGLAALHNVFVLEHNRLAAKLAYYNPHWNDEKLFQEARKICIAAYQKITYNDYFVQFLGRDFALNNQLIYNVQGGVYVDDYDVNVNPTPYAEFGAVAFRYGHHMIPGSFRLVSPDFANVDVKRLSDYFSFPETVNMLTQPDGLAAVLRGLATHPSKNTDNNIDREMKYYMFRRPGQQFGSDVKSMDIQRGRDFGIGTYNELRKACGLRPARHWQDFSDYISPQKIKLLQQYYASPATVELSVGGSLEAHLPGMLFGPTFACIITKQLQNIRRGDRFWYEQPNTQSGFTPEQLSEIRKVTLSSLLCANGNGVGAVQPNAFVLPHASNQITPCEFFPQLDLSKWREIPPHQQGYY